MDLESFSLKQDMKSHGINDVHYTGEVGFGSLLPNRIKRWTKPRFALVPLHHAELAVKSWMTRESVLVASRELSERQLFGLVFDLESQETVFPKYLFESLFGKIKTTLKNPLDSTTIPKDVIGIINDHMGGNKLQKFFNCQHASKIPTIRLNDLVVPATIMYEKLNDGMCFLRASEATSDEQLIVLGFHFLKHYHFSVSFSTDGTFLDIGNRQSNPSHKSNQALCAICY